MLYANYMSIKPERIKKILRTMPALSSHHHYVSYHYWLTLAAWRTITSLAWISSSLKWEQYFLSNLQDLPYWIFQLQTSDGLSWEPLGTTACLRLIHKDRASVRVREEFSHSSTSLISSPISLIQCQQYPSMFMLGANAAHLLCSREAGGSAQKDYLLLYQAPPGKTEHLPRLTSLCSWACKKKPSCTQLFCPYFSEPGPGETKKQLLLLSQDKAWGWGPQNTAIHILVWGLGINNEPNCSN